MSAFNVLVTALHLVPEAQQMLQAAGGRIIFMEEPINEDTLTERLSTGEVDAVLLRGSKPFSARVLAASKGLKIIAKNGAGIDNVDLAEATRKGITVAVAAGANADAVAEHAIALMLTLVRDIHTLNSKVHNGGWEGTSWFGRDFRGSVVGIIGYGSIGRSTAILARALGAEVIVWSRNGRRADDFEVETNFERLLGRVDILSLHCPLTEATRGMIGHAEIARMKPGAMLINTARGPLINEQAVLDALVSGHLGGAALDVLSIEPPTNQPDLLELNHPNLIITPHITWASEDGVSRLMQGILQNLNAFEQGAPINVVS